MKIKKFNESSENQIFTNKLIQKVCEDYYDLKHVVRKYISIDEIPKKNIPKNVEKFRIPDDDAETYFDAKKYNL